MVEATGNNTIGAGARYTMAGLTTDLRKMVARVLCFLGFHDDVVVDASYGFGSAGNTTTYECKRCGRILQRSE